MKEQKGFTLIELLLVVGIIGILSGILVSVINPSVMRQKARDTQRISDLKKIQTSLELFFSDNISYPLTANLQTALEAGYIDDLPVAPSPGTYFYASNGSRYLLVAALEQPANSNSICKCSDIPGMTLVCDSTYTTNCYGLTNP
ncbi:MAG: prepilin-type N-terminal cleavage/methylation domain-containing protein [Patescibacteria group bacterium]|jgi:prepilin-type N-terminal cleavage/methylation domain-containing protein